MYILLIVLFVLLPVSIAYFIGRHKKIGFWLSLLICIITTPFIGFLIVSNSGASDPIGCKWCGNTENEAEYCGVCGKNWEGDVRPGFIKK